MSDSQDDPRRRHSAKVVDGPGKSASRAMLRAVGFTDEDFHKPQVGIASTWSQVTPCNSHIGELAERACEGADGAGGKGVIFNTITISDGIANIRWCPARSLPTPLKRWRPAKGLMAW